MKELELEYGYKGFPQETAAVWGARAIAEKGYMDLLIDRQGRAGRDVEKMAVLIQMLNGTGDSRHKDAVGILSKMQLRYSELRRQGVIEGDKANDVVLYEDDRVKAVGNTNASYGYIYIAAWFKPEVSDE